MISQNAILHFFHMSSGMNFSSLLYPVWSTNSLNITPAIVCYSDFQEYRYMYFSLLKVILPGYISYTKYS